MFSEYLELIFIPLDRVLSWKYLHMNYLQEYLMHQE